MEHSSTNPGQREVRLGWLVFGIALLVGMVGAKPFAGGWNDGSRLAAVQSLGDRGTYVIDESIFVKVPRSGDTDAPPPYDPRDLRLNNGTFDKLYIKGRYYSDKTPVISALMAAVYRLWLACGGPNATSRPDLFCLLMTMTTVGLGYAVAVHAIYRLSGLLQLPLLWQLALAASFAFGTVAWAYTQQVNNHDMLLAVAAVLIVELVRLYQRPSTGGRTPWLHLIGLGCLAGLGYNLDLAMGPMLLICLTGLVAFRQGRFAAVVALAIGATPWVLAHHAIAYTIGGTITPMNTVAAYSVFPGSPFDASNLTGHSHHSLTSFVSYAASMWFGKRGFMGHNLPLFLCLPALVWLLKSKRSERPEIVCVLAWIVGSWLLYAAMSNNSSGVNLTIRWFIPLLAGFYFLLALVLRDFPEYRGDFLVLNFWAVGMGVWMWWLGPWTGNMVPGFWPIQGLALGSWAWYRWRQRQRADANGLSGSRRPHRCSRRSSAERRVGLNVARMRLLDRWLGVPACWLLTRWHSLFGRRTPPSSFVPRRILFVKLAEQGSTVLAQTALRAAIARVGRENVYFLLFAENRPILDILDLVPPDNVIAINARGLLGVVCSALSALWRLRTLGIDAALDLEFFARSSAALCYLSGAVWRVGFHGFNGEASYRGDLMTHRLSFNPYLHTSQTFLTLVEALDQPLEQLPTFDRRPSAPVQEAGQFQPTPAERAEVIALLGEQVGKNPTQRLVLLNANASDLIPLRRWERGRYVELARRLLSDQAKVVIAFTGADAEAGAVEKLVRQIDSPRCVSLAGKTTLRQLMALYGLAEVLVTNDSGPAHFASLTPIDVVVLFGPETPRLFAAVSPRSHPLWAGLACSPCINAFNDRVSPCRDNVCMQRISVDEVFDRVCQLLDERCADSIRRRPLPLTRGAERGQITIPSLR